MSRVTHRAQAATGRGRSGTDIVRTPAWLAREMCVMAGVGDGVVALDPCAGDGAIMRVILGVGATAKGIEIDGDLARACRGEGLDVMEADFLAMDPPERFRAVVMNPPFSKLGAWRFMTRVVEEWLAPGGRCVSVMPQYVLDNAEGRKAWLDEHVWSVRIIPKDTFAPLIPVLHACVVETRREPRPLGSAFGYLVNPDGERRTRRMPPHDDVGP